MDLFVVFRGINFLCFTVMLVLTCNSKIYAEPTSPSIPLSLKEHQFIKDNPEITIGAGKSFEPFVVQNQDGSLTGHDVQVANLIADRTGLKIRFVYGVWGDVQEAAAERNIDGLMSAVNNTVRAKIFNSSLSYISVSSVAIVKINNPSAIKSTRDLNGKKVAIQRDNKLFEDVLDKEAIDAQIHHYDSIHDMLRAVVSGEVDVCLLDEAASYLAEQLGLKEFIEVSFTLGEPYSLSFLLRNDMPELRSIFDKGIASISAEERIQLKRKWFGGQEDHTKYNLLLKITLGLSVLLVLTIFWSHRVRSSREHIRQMLSSLEEKDRELQEKNSMLENLSSTDHLTQLINRSKLDSILNSEIKRFKRSGSCFSVIMIDIDFFKKINDEFGHPAGDITLIEFAKVLSQRSRSVDAVGRWGGEEFLIVCPDTDETGAEALAEELRQSIEKSPFSIEGNHTASFGVASVSKSDSAHSLISKADQALYLAKQHGRNRVERFTSLDVK